MFPDLVWRIVGKILDTLSVVLPSAIACAIVLLILSWFSSQACNPGRTWWRNPGLFTDACYLLVVPFLAPYMRMSLLVVGATLLAGAMTKQDISDYLERGR
jgi:hypothetical protein